jgi:hypothetical protein
LKDWVVGEESGILQAKSTRQVWISPESNRGPFTDSIAAYCNMRSERDNQLRHKPWIKFASVFAGYEP